MRRPLFRSAVAAAAALLACRGVDSSGAATIGGTLIIATGQEADALLPPLIETAAGRQAVDLLYMPIARLGDSLDILGDDGFEPALADRWTWSADSLALTFHLDRRARWSDGMPVRAEDVQYSFGAYRAPGVSADAAPHLANLDSVSVTDSATFTVWYGRRSVTQFFDVAHYLIPFPSHVYAPIAFDSLRTSAAARAPVGSGKYRLARWEPGVRLELVADTGHWASPATLHRVIWLPVPDPQAQVAKLVTGEADMVELLRGPALAQAAQDTSLQFLQRPSFDFAMALFNFRDPTNRALPHGLFADVRVRRALSLAIDRDALVRNVLDTLGLAMPSPLLSAYGIPGARIPAADSAQAAALLDSAGWRDSDGDGVRERGGRRLAFRIIAPTTSAARVRASVILQEAFRRVGAEATLEHVEAAVHGANTSAGKFDLSIMGYSSGPSPAGLRQYWSSNQGGGSNFGRFEHPGFDALVDSALSTVDGRHSRELLGRAADLLIAEAPAIWLYELRAISGLHKRFQVTGVRADAWWARLDAWRVNPERMLPRDRAGLQGVPRD
jgi:peptide/nickel transport system substrate-binding protein